MWIIFPSKSCFYGTGNETIDRYLILKGGECLKFQIQFINHHKKKKSNL